MLAPSFSRSFHFLTNARASVGLLIISTVCAACSGTDGNPIERSTEAARQPPDDSSWPFNTAHAASIDGGRMHGAITRLSSFAQVEQLISAGIPVSISVAYGKGELTRSPVSSTAGHLIVVRGFASNGDVVCNDPAFGSDATVEVTYDRTELTNAWRGTTYLVWPTTTQLPDAHRLAKGGDLNPS